MKKIPKLYTKNNKGRYEEYKIPECDTSDILSEDKWKVRTRMYALA